MRKKQEELKYLPFVEWLWSKRGVERYFDIGVLTNTNADGTLPKPPLSRVESDNLFSFLQEHGLATEKDHIQKDVYRLNTVDEYKWNEFKKYLKKSYWRRSWWWNDLTRLPYYLLGLVVAALLGSYFGKMGEDAYSGKELEQRISQLEEKVSKIPGQNSH